MGANYFPQFLCCVVDLLPMGTTRSGLLKRRASGGKKTQMGRKKKCHLSRPVANTKIGEAKVKLVKCRGNVTKKRALSLSQGSFSFASINASFKTTIHHVKYHATSPELVRSDILTKGGIVEIDSTPLKMIIERRLKKNPELKLDSHVKTQLDAGNKIYAKICSRPGQVGVANGTILEGAEFEFYNKKIAAKAKHA